MSTSPTATGGTRPGAAPPVPGVGAPPVPQRSGTVAWALGFLAYVPLPFLNVLVAGIVQLIVGIGQRKHGGLAAVNGVRAANWGLTQLCWPLLLVLSLAIAVLTGTPEAPGEIRFHPVMHAIVVAVLGLYLVLGLLQLVYALVGTAQASKGRAVRLPVIPFLRTPRD